MARRISYEIHRTYSTLHKEQIYEEMDSRVMLRGPSSAPSANQPTLSTTKVYEFSRIDERVVGRVYTVGSLEGYHYFLRTFHIHKTGAKTFAYMRTVSGMVCVTYRGAFQKLGSLTKEGEWKIVLSHGFESSFQPLAKLLALITSRSQPAD